MFNFPFTFSKSKSKTDNVGSYGRAIPGSLGPGSGLSYIDYSKKNMANTVDALIASGQTVFGFNADDGTMGVEDGPYWVDFLALLDASAGTGIKIFATVRERHLIKGITNRWGVLGGTGGGINRIADPPYSSDSESALAWVVAATEFSALSLLHPHFIGFSIDDYGPVMSPTLGGYTEVETSNITIAAKSHNPNFKFWPTQYFAKMLEQIIPSTVIGMTSESRMYVGEYVATEFSFDVASEEDKPTVAMLSFLFHDENQAGYGFLWKKFSINDEVVYDKNTHDWQFIEHFNEDIADNIVVGDNKVRMEVYANNTVTTWASKLLYIETPLLVFDNTKIITLSQTFDVMSSYRGFTALDDPLMDPNASGVLPTGDAKIIAQPAGDFGEFSNNVDGFFAVYANKTVDNRNQPIPPGEWHDVMGDARFLCRKYKSAIGKKELHYIEQAYLTDKEIKSSNVINKFRQVSDIASSTVAWNWPIDMHDLSIGVFSEKAPAASSASTNLVILSLWPERHTTVPSWGQKWTTIAQYSGWITVKVKDSHITGTPGVDERFNKRISTSEDVELYNDGTYGIEPDGSTAAYTAEWKEYDLGPTPINIIFEVSIVGGVGNSFVKVEFGMRPGKIDGTGEGPWLVNSDFSFSNNEIVDSDFIDAHDDIKAYFNESRWNR